MPAETLQLSEDFPAVSYDQWRAKMEADLKGAPFDKKLKTPLYEGITVEPLYMKDAVAADSAGLPGQGLLTRGSQAVASAWNIRQSYNYPDVKTANEVIGEDLCGGVNGITLRYHQDARVSGTNSASPDADGVLINQVADLDASLNNVDLSMVTLSLDAGAAAVPASYQALALIDQRGTAADAVSLRCNIDPLAVIATGGTLVKGLAGTYQQAAALALHNVSQLPGARTMLASGAPYHEAGASATQEIAATAATALAYWKALIEHGVDAASAARQIVLGVSLSCDQFMEIAKIRALRSVWARILEASGIADQDRDVIVDAVTGQRMLSKCDPWVNMLRVTVSGFAAAVAGADAITVAPYDALLGPSDGLARRVARNTQIILNEESHLSKVTDPAGGAWYIESMTEQLAAGAWTEFQAIEAAGGMAQALSDGSFASKIADTWVAREKNLGKRKDPVTGVSEFPNIDEELPARPLPDLAALQASATVADDVAVSAASVEEAIAAATQGASLSALNEASAPESGSPLPVHRLADGFEAMREAAEKAAESGNQPSIFLANMGPIAHHTARAMYSKNFFEAGGIKAIGNDGFKDAATAAEAFKASGASMAIICSSDKLYPEFVPAVTAALKEAGAKQVILAGRPAKDMVDEWNAAGVDDYIYMGSAVQTILTSLLEKEGIL